MKNNTQLDEIYINFEMRNMLYRVEFTCTHLRTHTHSHTVSWKDLHQLEWKRNATGEGWKIFNIMFYLFHLCIYVCIYFKKPEIIKIFIRLKQRWFRARSQRKRFLQEYSIVNTQRETQECASRRSRAASVIQKAVRRFLLRKKQENFNKRIAKIQVTENIMILQFILTIPNILFYFIFWPYIKACRIFVPNQGLNSGYSMERAES